MSYVEGFYECDFFVVLGVICGDCFEEDGEVG